MKLAECQLGKVVTPTAEKAPDGFLRVGHIVGLKLVSRHTGGVQPLVLWAGNEVATPHDVDDLEILE